MTTLKEIRERDERDAAIPPCACKVVDDRAFLLAEVERLTKIADAFDAFRATCDDHPLLGMTNKQGHLWDDACGLAELRKAAAI